MTGQATATPDTLAAIVRAFPGLHVREVAREAGVSKQLANYHLRQLVVEGRLQEIRDGEFCRFFASDAGLTRLERETVVLLRQPALLKMVLLLLERRTATQTELASLVGLSKATVSYHVGRLRDANLVHSRDAGLELVDPAAVRAILLRWQPPTSFTERTADLWGRFYGHARKPSAPRKPSP